MWRSLSLLPLAVGCIPDEVGREVQSGDAVACLAAPVAFDAEVTVSGIIVADGAPDGDEGWTAGARCDEISRRFSILDGDQTWHVGYGWTEDGPDATQVLDITPESEVDLYFMAQDERAGFVLTQLERIVAATSVGIGDPALLANAVPGLEIRDGRTTGTQHIDCGTQVSRSIVFRGDEDVDLEPVDSDWLHVDGQLTRAWALAAWGVRNATCDQDGELSWAIWRTEEG
ncbi:MAG: hypothetical protein H6738_22860 [Alphaproteobacteria bacterium]|nr:hypothetical protein [Alphaproteobacteria bacterium]MCB9699644.1 hypothetical protein [Alphaproteobacteria bacterium]